MRELTADRLRELLDYDTETGEFFWRVTRRGKAVAGSVAGATNVTGYRQIGIDDTRYLAHRLAWMYVHGKWPAEQIDHINGVRDDNRLVNLRQASSRENMQNKRIHREGNLPGAMWREPKGKFVAMVTIGRKQRHLGVYRTEREAHAAYLAAVKLIDEGADESTVLASGSRRPESTKGVSWHRASGKYMARVSGIYLGLYSTFNEARAACLSHRNAEQSRQQSRTFHQPNRSTTA